MRNKNKLSLTYKTSNIMEASPDNPSVDGNRGSTDTGVVAGPQGVAYKNLYTDSNPGGSNESKAHEINHKIIIACINKLKTHKQVFHSKRRFN